MQATMKHQPTRYTNIITEGLSCTGMEVHVPVCGGAATAAAAAEVETNGDEKGCDNRNQSESSK